MWPYRVFISLWGALPVVLAILALRPVSQRERNRFINRYGVDPTAEAEPALKKYVRRGRCGRLIGAAIGLSLHPILYALGLSIPNESAIYGVFGYLLGAFVTALVPRSRATGSRSASLFPRRLSDYLPRSVLFAPTAAVGISALAVAVCLLEPRRALPPNTGSTFGLLGVSATAAVATFVAIRIVVARPQPIVNSGLLAVDDAVRTQTLHTLGAAGMAIAFLGAAACLLEMGGNAAPRWLQLTGDYSGLIMLFGSLCAWMFIGSAWRVQRTNLR